MSSFKYIPFTEKQLKIFAWWQDESPYKNKNGIICDGAVRSGKSLIMSESFVFWAFKRFSGMNFGISGKSIGSLRRNVINQLKALLPKRGYKVIDHRSENYLEISFKGRTNIFYLFGGRDERSRDFVQGFTAAGFFFDEVTLMPRSFVEQCLARCSVEGAKYWFNCNPEGPYHWFKTEYVDKVNELNLYRLRFKLYDNPSLSEETIQRYQNLFSGVFRLRFVEGEWTAADGIIYDNFGPENLYNALPTNIEKNIMPVYGCDYGVKNPMAYLEAYIVRERKKPVKIYIEKEYYHDGRNTQRTKTDSEYLADLNSFVKNEGVHRIVIDPSATSFCVACRRDGWIVAEANNDVFEGISRVHTMIHNQQILVNEANCPNLLKEMGSYQWDSKKAENGKEQPIKQNDHALDALRYICMTFIRKNEVII